MNKLVRSLLLVSSVVCYAMPLYLHRITNPKWQMSCGATEKYMWWWQFASLF